MIDRYDDFASDVTLSVVRKRVGRIFQRIAPVDHGFDLPNSIISRMTSRSFWLGF